MGGAILHEQPEDPGCDPFPSLFDTRLFKGMVARTGCRQVKLDQCAFGGPSRKPTELWGTVAGLQQMALCCPGCS
eukprot:5288719-Alexandrium_andersonii.AAC.1